MGLPDYFTKAAIAGSARKVMRAGNTDAELVQRIAKLEARVKSLEQRQ